mmetsp:Transcript_6288/g.7967  ORF Transcript_6288/g.7967 Transcript_6288/m.7967 type:complete len:553 (-) Transcript_6288:206-1864(-)
MRPPPQKRGGAQFEINGINQRRKKPLNLQRIFILFFILTTTVYLVFFGLLSRKILGHYDDGLESSKLSSDNTSSKIEDLERILIKQKLELSELKEQLKQQTQDYEKNLADAQKKIKEKSLTDTAKTDNKLTSYNSKKGYDPSKVLYLNVSDSSVLKDRDPDGKSESKYSIDVLTIGSIHTIGRAETQAKTWASHVSRRHFWLATEYDDPEPSCHETLTWEDIEAICYHCKRMGLRFWRERNAENELTTNWHNLFAHQDWLKQKDNPAGWMCAQKRFVAALSKLLATYREAREKYSIDLPDYLIMGDDDTYVNLEIVEEMLLRTPEKEVKDTNMTFDEELNTMVYPTKNTPVVWAGCRVRHPQYIIQDTIPYGGYGILFSKASLERLIQPIYCNETRTGFEWEACEHWTPTYANWSIGEKEYWEPGMSISDLMGTYVSNLNPFCLHSDWAIGYFVNHFNISRHVVPTGHLHPDKAPDDKIYFYNDQMGDVKHARLHAFHDGSEIYKRHEGHCKKFKKRCDSKAGVCHEQSEGLMEKTYRQVKALYPKKYRHLL